MCVARMSVTVTVTGSPVTVTADVVQNIFAHQIPIFQVSRSKSIVDFFNNSLKLSLRQYECRESGKDIAEYDLQGNRNAFQRISAWTCVNRSSTFENPTFRCAIFLWDDSCL